MSIKTPILLIGPVRAGKSTLANLVAARLNLRHTSLDEQRWVYYRERGYNDELARQIRAQAGFLALVFYRQLFDAYSVERILADFPGSIIDCGAGVGPYENTATLERVQGLLEPIPNIFLLLPAPDFDESLRILKERDPSPPKDLTFDINGHFMQHPGYRLLAKRTLYTQGKTPEQSCAEIISLLA